MSSGILQPPSIREARSTLFWRDFSFGDDPKKKRTQYSVIDDWEHGYPILRKAWDNEAGRKQAFDEFSVLTP